MRPIFLCGFMGAGKSSVGRLLAMKLDLPFYDTDQMVIKASQKSIAQIFADEGEESFRLREADMIKEVLGCGSCVVALGGGALNMASNLALIQSRGVLVYLRANAKTLESRLERASESRPLLAGLDRAARAKKIAKLLEAREKIYENADIEIQTDDLDASAVTDKVLQRIIEIGAHLNNGTLS